MIEIMNRSELIEQLAIRHCQFTLKDIELTVHTVLDAMSHALSQGRRGEVRGFGSFSLNYRPPRKGRNPKAGTPVMIPAKHVPYFRAGKELRDRVDVT